MNSIKEATQAGAKFHFNEEMGKWICLDMKGTPLWTLSFSNLYIAALAYLIVIRK
jgi:hypothetical protein